MGYELKYVSASGKTLELSKRPYFAIFGGLPSWSFDPVTLNDRVVKMARDMGEVEFGVNIVASDHAERVKAMNDLYEIPAADRVEETPGRLYFNDWYIVGYLSASSIGTYWYSDDKASYNVGFTPTEPLWTRETVREFLPSISSDGLGFPFDFSFDFVTASSSDTVVNDNYSPSFIRLTMQGAVDNPTVTIGGNEYRVDVSVAAGERLEIDGLRKTIEVVKPSGERVNVFSKRHGTQVVGSGSYVFEKLSPGISNVVFTNGMTFSVTVIEQRAEPRWA